MTKRDQDLQRYFDGELAATERAGFEASLTDDEREQLAALGEMQLLVSSTLDAEAADVDLWRGVEAGIKKARVRRWRDRVGARGNFAGASLLMAALATFLFVVRPWHPRHADNNCDIESLEVDGALATVLTVHDAPHSGDGATTIIWAEEE